jgi:hypothetical protein
VAVACRRPRVVDAPAQLLAILAREIDRADVLLVQLAFGVADEAVGKRRLDRSARCREGLDRVVDPAVDVVGGEGKVVAGKRLDGQAHLEHRTAVGQVAIDEILAQRGSRVALAPYRLGMLSAKADLWD